MEHGTSPNSACAYKLDLSIAYDRVDWSFLESTMQKMGFSDRWVQWIMPYVTTVNMIFSQIQRNLVGCIFSYTRVKAGRLSPFLFLFVLDGLSALLKHEVDQNSITSIRVCRRVPGISHILTHSSAYLTKFGQYLAYFHK
jgi:hypothetical protein